MYPLPRVNTTNEPFKVFSLSLLLPLVVEVGKAAGQTRDFKRFFYCPRWGEGVMMSKIFEATKQLFNHPQLRMLPDVIFFQRVNGVIVPTDNMGLLYTKDEIKEVVRALSQYINVFPDEQVSACRDEFFMKYFPERYGLPRQKTVKRKRDRTGFVYLILRADGCHKIGRSRSPNSRLKAIQGGVHSSAELIHKFRCDDMMDAERELHVAYQGKHLGGEWFTLSDSDVETIKSIELYQGGEFVRSDNE